MTEKAELDVHLSLQRALRAWLVLHVPPAIVLLGLLAVHVFAVLYLLTMSARDSARHACAVGAPVRRVRAT